MARQKAKARAQRIEAESALQEGSKKKGPNSRGSHGDRGRGSSRGAQPSLRSQGVSRWQAYAQDQGQRNAGVPSHLIDDDVPFHPFTLNQEARNTGFNHNYNNLRSQQVSFVSAGNLKPDDVIEKQMSEVSLEQTQRQTDATVREDLVTRQHPSTMDLPVKAKMMASEGRKPPQCDAQSSMPAVQDQNQYFFIDSTGSGLAPTTGIPPPHIRSLFKSSPSPSHSDSDTSEDEVVFAGRISGPSTTRRKLSPKLVQKQVPSFTSGSFTPVYGHPAAMEAVQADVAVSEPTSIPGASLKVPKVSYLPDKAPNSSWSSKKGRRRQQQPSFVPLGQLKGTSQSRRDSGEEDALLDDYIANMQDFDTADRDSIGQLPLPVSSRDPARALSWSSADLDDLDALSTSDEMPMNVGRIYSKRQRALGHQYLVVATGQTADDARWIRHELLTMDGAAEAIRTFEVEESKIPKYDESLEDSETGSDDALIDDLVDALESEEDEMAITEMLKAQMSDEQIARALHMQEQLGMATDDVLLFDGAIDKGDRPGKRTKAHVLPERRSGRKSRRSDGFPSAELFADVLDEDPYNGFDVMDFERPSLRKKSKGKRANLPFELEDSELEGQMQEAWDNDRLKKKERKQEREELRAAGLLGGGKKANKAGKAMLDEAKEQIISFLKSDEETLLLPAMESQERLYMHQIATFFEIDSKSHGPPKSRATMMTKRIDTPDYERYSATMLIDMMQHKNVRKLPAQMGRRTKIRASVTAKVRRTRGGGGTLAGVSYMDGEVVGAAAPELAADNKGRGMLEKMGWSHGMALGSVTNKGILQPITHVVKNTKAGLG